MQHGILQFFFAEIYHKQFVQWARLLLLLLDMNKLVDCEDIQAFKVCRKPKGKKWNWCYSFWKRIAPRCLPLIKKRDYLHTNNSHLRHCNFPASKYKENVYKYWAKIRNTDVHIKDKMTTIQSKFLVAYYRETNEYFEEISFFWLKDRSISLWCINIWSRTAEFNRFKRLVK